MIGQFLRQLENITQFQMAVSLLFFLLFLFIVYLVIKGNKKVYENFGDIPLETENQMDYSQEKTE